MAKKKEDLPAGFKELSSAPEVLTGSESVAVLNQPPASGKPRYKVALQCPTPLRHPELVVDADTESDAKAAFCKANGIDDSVHRWTITRV